MKYRFSTGFVLLESLFAMGLLAMALLLASYPLFEAKNAWRDAVIRQYAAHLAFNAISRIRANNSTATDFGMDYATGSLWGSVTNPSCNQTCSSRVQMQLDAAELQQEWQQHHPHAGISVNDCTNALCVLVWWDDTHVSAPECTGARCLRVRFLP